MTEGPEATYLANYVNRFFKGKSLKGIKINAGRYKRHGPPQNYNTFTKLLPLKLIEVFNKGKVIFMYFENGWYLICKMGMSGWFFKEKDKPIWESAKYNIIFEFENDDLMFDDTRNFGTLVFTNDIELIKKELDNIAPDLLGRNTTFSVIKRRLEEIYSLNNERIMNMAIEDALMDQTLVFSGVGNIIKSEMLYDTRISPLRKFKNITDKEWNSLYLSGRKIMKTVIRILNKKEFKYESYFDLHSVYQKEYDPLGNRISTRISKLGRKTYWVPALQK